MLGAQAAENNAPKDGPEQLESHVASFDPGLKLFVAIAAKYVVHSSISARELTVLLHRVATLHALAGRYTQHLTLADLSPPSSSPSSPSSSDPPGTASSRDTASQQRELDAEQERVRNLMRATIAHATHWLVLVCNHFEVEMQQLPEEPDSGMKMFDALDAVSPEEAKELVGKSDEEKKKRRAEKEFNVVWELLLLSLGLVGGGQQGGEKEREKKAGTLGGAASKVGGLFSSTKPASSSASTTPSNSKDATPPPLSYTALSRSLVVSAASVLGISSQVVLDVEHAIAQFLYFQLQQQDPKAIEAATTRKPGEGGKDWDKAAQEYKEKAAKKGTAMKWAATGAGFVLGGVAIGLTGGALPSSVACPHCAYALSSVGLAAPALAPVLAGTLGIAAFSGAGGAVLIGTLLGLGGGGLAGYRTHRRMKGLESVSFEPIQDEDAHELPQIPSLTATSAHLSLLNSPALELDQALICSRCFRLPSRPQRLCQPLAFDLPHHQSRRLRAQGRPAEYVSVLLLSSFTILTLSSSSQRFSKRASRSTAGSRRSSSLWAERR